MGEWGKIGVGYKMGSTAYGIEAVLGGGGVPAHLFSTVQVFNCTSVQWCGYAALQKCCIAK